MQTEATYDQGGQQLADEQQFQQLKNQLADGSGKTYTKFKKTLTPRYGIVWRDIFNGWAMLALVLFTGAWLLPQQQLWLTLIICLLTGIAAGYTIAFLVNFFHEAVHYNIAENKERNDRLANIFIGILTAQGIKNYRPVHWQHHTNLGLPDDPERSYFESLNWGFVIRSLTGISVVQFLLSRNRFINKQLQPNTALLKKERWRQLIAGACFHTALLSLFFVLHQYWLMLSWITAVGCFYPFFNRLRQLIEHRSELAEKTTDYSKISHGKRTRLFGNTLLDKSFGSAGFNKHLLHHLEPSISYTRLAELEKFLAGTAWGKQLHANKTSYPETFTKLFNK